MANPFKQSKPAKRAPATPEELFAELHKPDPEIRGLLSQQADILREYHRTQLTAPDVAFELPTGTGKTLIGLVIAEWRRVAKGERAIYLVPTRQLANQVGQKATSYGLDVRVFTGTKHKYDPAAVQAYNTGQKVAVTTYSSIFNVKPGLSPPNLLILDDAHAAEDYIASMWSMSISRAAEDDLYKALVDIFSDDLPAAFLERVEEDGGRRAFEHIPGHVFAKRLQAVRDAVNARIGACSDNARFAWDLLRDNLHGCWMYLDKREVLIRPLTPPTPTHGHFSAAKQRIYMSATLGKSGDLERMVGVPKIVRIATPATFQSRGTGRRFFLFPDAANRPEDYQGLLLDLLRLRKKALLLNRDTRRAADSQKMVEEAGLTVFEAKDIEDSLDEFLDAKEGGLVVTTRFDGIDLPGESCRLLFLLGRPDAVNLQERFLLSRLGMTEVMRDRITVRFSQAVGRCTRSQNDYALVVPLGADLLTFCSLGENRAGMHPELVAEIQEGLGESSETNPQGLLAKAVAFFEQGEAWKTVDDRIRELRMTVALRQPRPTDLFLAKQAPSEVEFSHALWAGNLERAAEKARSIVDSTNLSGLEPYQALWAYRTGSVYLSLAARTRTDEHRKLGAKYLGIARAAGGMLTWYGNLGQELPEVAAVPGTIPTHDAEATENLQRLIGKLGLRGVRFENHLKEVRENLAQTEHVRFEMGLQGLGSLLGWTADRPAGEGDPDSVWTTSLMTVAFEAKSEEVPKHGVSKATCTQAQGHLAWLQERRRCPPDKSRIVVITPRSTLSVTAKPNAKGLFYLSLEDARRLLEEAQAMVRAIRNNISDVDSENVKATILKELTARGLRPEDILKRLTGRPLEELPTSDS